MKKVIFSALLLLCITATGAWAQKGNAEQPTETGATSTSSAREGKNVGKGSPMIQRTAGGSGATNATGTPADAPATKAAPAPAPAPAAAPAPATAPAQAPANNTEAHPAEHKSNKILPVLVSPPPSNNGQKE